MRSSAVREGGPQLMLILGEGLGSPEVAPPGYATPVRSDGKARPEWQLPLSSAMVDLPDPEMPTTHLEIAIDLLRRAAQAGTVSEQGDATLEAMEHAARSFGELFDADVAKKLLRDIADRL